MPRLQNKYTTEYLFSSTKTEKSEIVKLFLAGRYDRVIEAFGRPDPLTDPEKLLVAKSFEKLDMYHRANRVMKALYYSKTSFAGFVPFFVGRNYERLEDYYNALKWYGLTLHSKRSDSDYEEEIALVAALERVVTIAGIDPRSFDDCVKAVQKGEITAQRASYYLGRMFEDQGDNNRAAAYYREAIEGTNNTIRKKALQKACRNRIAVNALQKDGLRSIDLLTLLVEEGLFEEALQIVYHLPKNRKTARIAALCHYRTKDYETAEVLYKEYYSNYLDTYALRMLAFCAYYNGKRSLSHDYRTC